MRMLHTLGALAAAVPLALAPAAAGHAGSPSHAGPPSPATYLALGDSVAAGIGATSPTTLGYVPLLAAELADARNCGKGKALGCRLELVNASVSGATTVTLIAEQLPGALALLEERNGNATPVDDVRLITITIGGNDVFRPILQACAAGITATCQQTIAAQLQQVSTNYATILGQLRQAAGPDTTIAVTTYYSGLRAPGCVFGAAADLGDLVLEGGGPVTTGLNDIIRLQAEAFGAVVVEGGEAVQPEEVRSDCLHPDDEGHADLADAFADAVAGSVAGPPGKRR